ncbi:hypothetical protein FJZ31_39090 [Candidatus Poribacteria bacterium]|nr:hypothetical protein [Candidatus Poribacteria bacterium]
MSKETFEELSVEEFDDLIENFINRGDDRIELSTFLKAMAEIEKEKTFRVVELSGEFANGEVIFDTPSLLTVQNNEITVGDTKIVLKLRPVSE